MPGRVAIQPLAHSNVGVLVDGRVEAILVHPGDAVAAGAPLLRIQSTGGSVSRAEADLAAARLTAAEESLKRITTMVTRGVATEVERLEAEMRVRETRIDADRTRKTIALLGEGSDSQLALVAPTGGIVLAVNTALGAVVQAGTEVVQIGDPAHVWVEADVSEDEAAAVTSGQAARIELFRGGGNLPGLVDRVTAQIDPATHRRHIFIMPDPDVMASLTLGLPVEVRLQEPSDQIVLPVEAVLIKDGDRRIVYVASADRKFRARDVVVGNASGGLVRVLKGLSPGERVVTKGALLLDGHSEQLL